MEKRWSPRSRSGIAAPAERCSDATAVGGWKILTVISIDNWLYHALGRVGAPRPSAVAAGSLRSSLPGHTRAWRGPRGGAASTPNVAMALARARARTAVRLSVLARPLPLVAGPCAAAAPRRPLRRCRSSSALAPLPLARAPVRAAERLGAPRGRPRPARPGVRCDERRHACAPNVRSVGPPGLGGQPPSK